MKKITHRPKTTTPAPPASAGAKGKRKPPPPYGLSFVDSTIQRKPNNTGMPDQLKHGIEALSGMDMSDVNVHYNSAKPAQLNALAYAQGNQIHVASGQEKHLPHEAWHVAQQKQGRVQATIQAKGVPINDDPALEHEADRQGAKAAQLKTKTAPLQTQATHNSNSPVQRFLTVGDKDIVQYRDYGQLPGDVKKTVDTVRDSDRRYKDLADWIGQWDTYMRMQNPSDDKGLIFSIERFLKDARAKPKLNKDDRVYGLGGPERTPKNLKLGREFGKGINIQDTLNNAVAAGGQKDLEGQPLDFARHVEKSKYAPTVKREGNKPWTIPQSELTAFKKLCKAGIIFHTKSSKAPVTIHFDLSGLDMYDVVRKSREKGGSITRAELRSIYREYLLQVRGYETDIDLSRIKFYFLGYEVDPPWIEDRSLWETYKPRFLKTTPRNRIGPPKDEIKIPERERQTKAPEPENQPRKLPLSRPAHATNWKFIGLALFGIAAAMLGGYAYLQRQK